MSQMYSLNDHVVCRGQGVGEIVDIVEKTIAGTPQAFYVLKIINKDVQIMVPTSNDIALRNILPKAEVKNVLDLLSDTNIEVQKSNWNKRYREYNDKLRNGSVYDLVDILKELNFAKTHKKLSFGERKIFEQAKELLIQEIAASEEKIASDIESDIDICLQSIN